MIPREDKDWKSELVYQDLNDKFVTGLCISHLCYRGKMLLQYFLSRDKSDRALFYQVVSLHQLFCCTGLLQIPLGHHRHLSHCSLKCTNERELVA